MLRSWQKGDSMDMTNKTVRLTVGALLDERGISTQELADAAGINYRTALQLRRGFAARLDLVTLGKICTALECQLSDLIELVEEPESVSA